jgi:hypothetical protein
VSLNRPFLNFASLPNLLTSTGKELKFGSRML